MTNSFIGFDIRNMKLKFWSNVLSNHASGFKI